MRDHLTFDCHVYFSTILFFPRTSVWIITGKKKHGFCAGSISSLLKAPHFAFSGSAAKNLMLRAHNTTS